MLVSFVFSPDPWLKRYATRGFVAFKVVGDLSLPYKASIGDNSLRLFRGTEEKLSREEKEKFLAHPANLVHFIVRRRD
jgi:hypothetical protein